MLFLVALAYVTVVAVVRSSTCPQSSLPANEQDLLLRSDMSCGQSAVCEVVNRECHITTILGINPWKKTGSPLEAISLEWLKEISFVGIQLSNASNLTVVSFPRLVKIAGNSTIYGCLVLEKISLPVLQSVAGWFVVDKSPVASVELSALVSVGHDISLHDTNLKSLALDSLLSVGATWGYGSVSIKNNSHLVTASFANLAVIFQGIDVEQNPKLADVDLAKVRLLLCKAYFVMCATVIISVPKLYNDRAVACIWRQCDFLDVP
jgi:hypothetical protein